MAGCAFAAMAASSNERFGWQQYVLPIDTKQIDLAIESAIETEAISTASLIFPEVVDLKTLLHLIGRLAESKYVFVGQDTEYEGFRCLGLRVSVGANVSWVSGFGPFSFLPRTRQAPYTELAFRAKPRPSYKWIMKDAPEGVIHLADMYMLGLPRAMFQELWERSFERTAQLLGHRPDLRSAAKTTFAIPLTTSTPL